VIALLFNARKSSRNLKNRSHLTIDGGDAAGIAIGSSITGAMELLPGNLKNVGLPICLILASVVRQFFLCCSNDNSGVRG
jgi:hypothetical protein